MPLCIPFNLNFNIHHIIKHNNVNNVASSESLFGRFQLLFQKQHYDHNNNNIPSGTIFNFSGKKPDYLGVQKNQPALALCPATKNCISTSENVNNRTHYAPPWNYNPECRKDRVSREEAMEELIDVIESTIPPENFTPRIVERTEDYLRLEYQSPILGFVDDVEFWFRPDRDSIVEYRSASRFGNCDFDVNRKRIKALRLELEKRGWASQDPIYTFASLKNYLPQRTIGTSSFQRI